MNSAAYSIFRKAYSSSSPARLRGWMALAALSLVSSVFAQASAPAASAPAVSYPPGPVAAVVEADRVVFGQSAKLTGSGGTQLGRQYRDGVLLAFKAANDAGGVHGRRVELLSLDDQINADKAVANTKTLIYDKHVFALVGNTFTNPVKAVLPMVRDSGVPLIAPYTGFPELYNGSQSNVFAIRASFNDELAAIVRHIDTVGYDQIALIYYGNTLGEEFRRDVEDRLKAVRRKLTVTASMPLNPKNPPEAVQPAVSALSGNCPKVIILGVSGRDAAALVHGMSNTPCEAIRYLARSLVDISLLQEGLGEHARGIMVTQVVPNPYRSNHPLTREYRNLLKKRDAAPTPDFTEFEGFIAGKFVVQSLRRAGRNLTRQGFISAMEAERLDGPGHYLIQFGPGQRVGSRYINIVMISGQGRISD